MWLSFISAWQLVICNSRIKHVCETRLIHMRDMTHVYDSPSFLRGSSSFLTPEYHMCVRHDSFIGGARLIHMRDMTHVYDSPSFHLSVGHDSFVSGT